MVSDVAISWLAPSHKLDSKSELLSDMQVVGVGECVSRAPNGGSNRRSVWDELAALLNQRLSPLS